MKLRAMKRGLLATGLIASAKAAFAVLLCGCQFSTQHAPSNTMLSEWSARGLLSDARDVSLESIKVPKSDGSGIDLTFDEEKLVLAIDRLLFNQICCEMELAEVERILGPPYIRLSDIAFYRRGINKSQMVAPYRFAGVIIRYSKNDRVLAKVYGGNVVTGTLRQNGAGHPTANSVGESHQSNRDFVNSVDAVLFQAVRMGMSRISVESILGAPISGSGREHYYRFPHIGLTPGGAYTIGAIKVTYDEMECAIEKRYFYR